MSSILKKPEKIIALKSRALLLKEGLQGKKGWKSDFLSKNKAYDTAYWSLVINNMLAGRTTDEKLIKKLEDYLKKYEENNSKK